MSDETIGLHPILRLEREKIWNDGMQAGMVILSEADADRIFHDWMTMSAMLHKFAAAGDAANEARAFLASHRLR